MMGGVIPLDEQHRSLLLDTARRTLHDVLSGQGANDIATEDPALLQPAGCFVSLHAQLTRRLRGCVGRLNARHGLLAAAQRNAVHVLEDPRFEHDPVVLGELASLEMEISILSPLRPTSGVLEFNPTEDGIYLTIGDRAGCFLPQVGRETGWTREQLLARLCTEKRNLPPGMWADPAAKLFVFTTISLGPERCVAGDVAEE